MGNRAYVVFADKDFTEFSPAVYLHWNGGPESIYAFLQEMDRRNIRRGNDLPFQVARFVHIVCDFFDADEAGGLSIGVVPGPSKIGDPEASHLADEENGLYVIVRGKGEPVVRRFFGEDWTEDNSDWKPDELAKHPYNDNSKGSIPSVFLELRPTISSIG